MAGQPIPYRRRRSAPPSPDRISFLPSEILSSVLSYLSLKEAIRTSVLARPWRDLWRKAPFQSLSFPLERFQDRRIYSFFVDSYLSGCGSCIKSLESMSFHVAHSELDEGIHCPWIDFAKERSVRSLSILSDPSFGYFCHLRNNVVLPVQIFSISSLNFLHLELCKLPIPPPPSLNCFPNLETLSLVLVILNRESLSGFTSNSPNLKNLKIEETKCEDGIVISSPSLETLEITKSYLPISNRRYLTVVCPIAIREVPELRVLSLCCDLKNVDLSQLDSTKLDRVKMFRTESVILYDMLDSLVFATGSARTLTVDYYWLLDYKLGDAYAFGSGFPFFKNLKELKICGGPFGIMWFPAIVNLLREYQNLEKLELQVYDYDTGTTYLDYECSEKYIPKNYDIEEDETIEQFKDSAEIAQSLKYVKISGHHGYEHLIMLIYFIATHADKLKKLQIESYYKNEFDIVKQFKWVSSSVKIKIHA